MRDGASNKCLTGYQLTKNNEEKAQEFEEEECQPGWDKCYSAKGSLVANGITCEFEKNKVQIL